MITFILVKRSSRFFPVFIYIVRVFKPLSSSLIPKFLSLFVALGYNSKTPPGIVSDESSLAAARLKGLHQVCRVGYREPWKDILYHNMRIKYPQQGFTGIGVCHYQERLSLAQVRSEEPCLVRRGARLGHRYLGGFPKGAWWVCCHTMLVPFPNRSHRDVDRDRLSPLATSPLL
jgi:hypothetical protein